MRINILAFLIAIDLGGCGQATSAAPSAPPTAARAPSATGGVPVTPHPGMSAAYPVVAATTCAGLGVAVAPASVALRHAPDGRWITSTAWGCGCPTAPVFTLAYAPRTSPLEVRLCIDQARDTCERGCSMPIAWRLDAPLREAGAVDVRVVP